MSIDGPEYAIEARGVGKSYHGMERPALSGVDLVIPRGSFFALLGPNGAGKSTFINIMAGLVRKSEGSLKIWGHDIDTARRAASLSIGIVPQELVIDPFFTPEETLELQAGYYGVGKNDRKTAAILEAMGLSDKAKAYARSLSGGMKRRLMVGKAMVHQPPILVLDEPTAGVDVELRQQLWDYVRKLNEAGVTVILTTHYLEEAEELCDHIAIINKGHVVACDRTENLLGRLDKKEIDLHLGGADDMPALPDSLTGLGAKWKGPGHLNLTYSRKDSDIGAILATISDAGFAIKDVTTHESDLEDLFLDFVRQNEAERQQAAE